MAHIPQNSQNGYDQRPPPYDLAHGRPFTLQEALPYSPQTSISPFVSELIPDPVIGSGPIVPSLADVFSRDEFEKLRQETSGQSSSSKQLKQMTDILIHEIKPSQRTKYKFKNGPKLTSHPATSHTLSNGLSPLSVSILDRVANAFQLSDADSGAPTPTNGQPSTPFVSKARLPSVKQNSSPRPKPHIAANAQAFKENNAKIEIAIPLKKQINDAEYMAIPDQFMGQAGPLDQTDQPTVPPLFRSNSALMGDDFTVSPADLQIVRPLPPLADIPVVPTSVVSPKTPKESPAVSIQEIPAVTPTPTPTTSTAPPAPAKSSVQTPVPVPRLPSTLPVAAPSPVPTATITPEDAMVSEATASPTVAATSITATVTADGSRGSGSLLIELQTTTLNKDEYIEMDDIPDTPPANASTRKIRGEDDVLGVSLNQRQKAEAALDDLRKLTGEVFGAVGRALAMEPAASMMVVLTQDQEPTMTTLAHQRVQAALNKVIELSGYDDVPIEDLLRLQKLCDGNLKNAVSHEIKVDDTWGELEFHTWLQQLPQVEAALRAARTSLIIMSGGREEKQLYSEETIQQCLDLFRGVLDGIIIPVVELRASGSSSTLFKLLSANKKQLSKLFVNVQKLFSIMASLVTKMELSDMVINTLEFTSSNLIFVENAHYEKDSAIGVQRFDSLRLVAIDMLCQIFLISPQQRQGIIDEILTSLEKLPVGKQSARHFKLAEGGSIQPVTALIMRLIQSSSCKIQESKARKASAAIQSLGAEEDNDDDKEENGVTSTGPGPGKVMATIRSEEDGGFQHAIAVKELESITSPLVDTAKRNASYVVNFIVKRALKSTKTGDTPYRNLLDLFVEDLTTCFDSPDWPASELLLRIMMFMMIKLSEGEKTAAPAKNMALDVLGAIGAAISNLRSLVRKTANSLAITESDEFSRFLTEMAHSALEQKVRPDHLVSWSGPYRTALEHLEEKTSEDPHLKNAISYVICDWADKTCAGYEQRPEDSEERDKEYGRLAYRLRMMIEDWRWLSNEYSFKKVTPTHARLSYAIIVLRSPLCEAFDHILNILLHAMAASDQATVRSKSLKSVNQVLETDPSILDKESVIHLILQCSSDSSTQVRDSALGLIGKCISMRPRLESILTPRIIERFVDTGVGVRKRAMKLARDIYLRNRNRDLRGAIANGLLLRVQDPDEGVRDLARQMIEEVWFAPFYSSEDNAAFQTSLTDHVVLMIQIVKNGNVAAVLDKVLEAILRPQQAKPAEGPFSVCTKLVANMFGLIDTLDSDDPSIPSGRDGLQVLMIFAKADPKLFTFEQIRFLKPHLSSFSSREDLHVFRATVVIYRRVLPLISTAHSQFFTDIRTQLLSAIGKVSRLLLDDVIACVWILCGHLNHLVPLARLAQSSLLAIQKLRAVPLDNKALILFQRYSVIVGMVGKHCDLDSELATFKQSLPKLKGKTVPALMLESLIPFASPDRPQEARKAALDAIGLVCQAWPRNYVSPNVYTTFQQVFEEKSPTLESMILTSFKEFLITEEKRSEAASAAPAGSGGAGTADAEKKRELTVMGGTNYDDVASATTQRFLKEITRIAVSTQDEHAFLAAEVLGSINRQGLVHPKETGVTLITLETSSMGKIAEVAFQEHRALHEKHETVLEREYARAIQSAFHYQRDINKDVRGATTNPFQSKLHLLMEVLKISKSKNRQRFLEKLCLQVDFDPTKLAPSADDHSHVALSRFIIENVAFFEYLTVGELLATVSTMEKIVTRTGANVAHAIESEVFNVRMDPGHEAQSIASADGQPELPKAPVPTPGQDVNPRRFRQLTAGAIILLCLWEARTYLRRAYGLGTNRRETKAKALAKDLNKTPVRVQGVTGDKFWEEMASHMTGLDSPETMMQKCKAVVELLNVDKEFKIDEDEDMNGENPTTPDAEDDDEAPNSERGRKRKASSTPGGRKKRPRSNSKPRPRGRPRKQSVEADAEGDVELDWF